MATRTIGLALGADLCWPRCFKDLLERWGPELSVDGELIRFEVDHLPIRAFELQPSTRYDVVVDRRSYWHSGGREWLKKSLLLDGAYTFNNPWTLQSMEKHTTYCAMIRLGLPIPDTWLLAARERGDSPDLKEMLDRYGTETDLARIGEALSYPLFMKPYDGGGWRDVQTLANEAELVKAEAESGGSLMLLQRSIAPYEHFVRCLGVGPQVRIMGYAPAAPLHERYEDDYDHLPERDLATLRATTLTINAFFGWEFNSCECLSQDGIWHPIDFANAWPDSQLTSLHRHFPWLVLAKLRWTLFCAATRRRFRADLDWSRFFEIADSEPTLEQRLLGYERLATERMSSEAFADFVEAHLRPLDEVALDYFGSSEARGVVRDKVTSLFPAHEHDEFTDRFWGSIQAWRADQGDRA